MVSYFGVSVDWDGDGVLDMIRGHHSHVLLFRNRGTLLDPVFERGRDCVLDVIGAVMRAFQTCPAAFLAGIRVEAEEVYSSIQLRGTARGKVGGIFVNQYRAMNGPGRFQAAKGRYQAFVRSRGFSWEDAWDITLGVLTKIYELVRRSDGPKADDLDTWRAYTFRTARST